ncbi:hypothetical protein D8B45_01505 [Candidatus Gracilibacteria bacterium]|nr:MAG: hypothetical protein D8B45_01505 [Candidatus Gracilibacteria bacterium]
MKKKIFLIIIFLGLGICCIFIYKFSYTKSNSRFLQEEVENIDVQSKIGLETGSITPETGSIAPETGSIAPETGNSLKQSFSSSEDSLYFSLSKEYHPLDVSNYSLLNIGDIIDGRYEYNDYDIGSFYADKNRKYTTFSSEYVKPRENQIKNINGGIFDSYLEDENYYYFGATPSYYSPGNPKIKDPNIKWSGVKKNKLPSFKLIGFLGSQSIDRAIGYSEGFLVLPPYKFPVDEKTFSPYPYQFWDNNGSKNDQQRKDYLKGEGKTFCRNGGRQYARCIGSDKNWIYRWTSNSWATKSEAGYTLFREKKEDDFKVLSLDELLGIVSSDKGLQLIPFSGEVDKNWEALWSGIGGVASVYYHDNAIYISRYAYGTRSFPIDGATMKREEGEFQEGGKEHPTSYNRLSDKNRRYQLIYHTEGDYYEVQRVKK